MSYNKFILKKKTKNGKNTITITTAAASKNYNTKLRKYIIIVRHIISKPMNEFI